MTGERVQGSVGKSKGGFNYLCQACGYRAPKWMGKCPDCGEFETIIEEPDGLLRGVVQGVGGGEGPVPITDVGVEVEGRVATGLEEFDRVLGGG